MENQKSIEKIVDKIATYFEKRENWNRLKDAWLENDKSYDLRILLRESLSE